MSILLLKINLGMEKCHVNVSLCLKTDFISKMRLQLNSRISGEWDL